MKSNVKCVTSSGEKCPACDKGSSSNAFPTFRNRPTDSAKKGLTFKSPRNLERLCPAPRNRKLGALLAHISCQKQASFFYGFVLCYIYVECFFNFISCHRTCWNHNIVFDLSTSCTDPRDLRCRIAEGYTRPRARAHQDSSASAQGDCKKSSSLGSTVQTGPFRGLLLPLGL